MRPVPTPDPLARRGWIVVATTLFTFAIIYGAWYSYSVFLVALLREFGWSRSLVAGAFSVFVLVHGALGPATGWLVRRTGARRLILLGAAVMGGALALTGETRVWWHLYLSFGGLFAVGFSLAGWIPSVVLIRGWFPGRLGTAMGVASAGIGVGIFALVPVTQLLIESAGWRWAFRILGLLIVGWVVPATFWLIQDPPEAADAPGGSAGPAGARPGWTLAGAVRTWRFWGVAGGYFAGNCVTQMLLIHQVAYLVDHGTPALTAATVGGTVGLVSIGSKIGWGILSDRAGREVTCSLAFACVVAAIGALALAGVFPATPLPYLYAVCMGLGYGVLSSVFPTIPSDLFGGAGFPTIFGALFSVICLGLAVGAWMAGQIFDLTGGYGAALGMGLLLALLTPLLLWAAAPRRPNPPPWAA